MNSGIFYHKRTGQPVQIIARAQTKPTFQEVICYQELTKPYGHFVMEKRQFFAEYVREFDELPLVGRKQISKRDDLPDKQPRISKGAVAGEPEEPEDPEWQDPKMKKLLAFFDADSFREKMKLFEMMEDELDSTMLNNIAVSLDLPLEDGVDITALIRSELKIRAKYEGERGDRL